MMLAAQPVKPLVPWYGGKARMAKIIAAKLPLHVVYCEPFGGAAGVLMYKTPSFTEVYNDLHSGIVTLFRVVRNPEKCYQLLDLLNLTPYSREEWKDCNSSWESEKDELEKARKVYVVLSQNFVGRTRHGSWSCGGPANAENVARSFYNSFENIKAVCLRLQNVLIENQPAETLLERWESPDTCFYLDPPYHPTTRSTKHKRKMGECHDYEHELNNAGHENLLNWCVNSKSKIILSGYSSPLYTEILEHQSGWIREDFESIATSAMQSKKNGLKGMPAETFKRTECLWFNSACIAAIEAQNKPKAKQATLFELEETA